MERTFAGLTLRGVLLMDAGLCLLMGVGLVALAQTLSQPTGLPTPFLTGAGLVLLPVALFILTVAAPKEPSRLGSHVVVLGNLLWVLASVGVLVSGLVQPSTLGLALVLFQAVGVAVIAAVEAALNRPLLAAGVR